MTLWLVTTTRQYVVREIVEADTAGEAKDKVGTPNSGVKTLSWTDEVTNRTVTQLVEAEAQA